MELIIEHLQNAIHQLEIGLKTSLENPKNDLYRDAVIQRFEYTYELSCKMLRRFLQHVSDSPAEINTMSFPTLIRSGWEQELLESSWDVWNNFREARNKTSHTYDEKKAKEVYEIIPAFVKEVNYFYNQLSKRLEQKC